MGEADINNDTCRKKGSPGHTRWSSKIHVRWIEGTNVRGAQRPQKRSGTLFQFGIQFHLPQINTTPKEIKKRKGRFVASKDGWGGGCPCSFGEVLNPSNRKGRTQSWSWLCLSSVYCKASVLSWHPGIPGRQNLFETCEGNRRGKGSLKRFNLHAIDFAKDNASGPFACCWGAVYGLGSPS